MELELGRKHLAFGVAVIILLIITVPFLNVPLPGLYTIHSAGVEIVAGDTVNSVDGLILTMDYQGLDAAADNICNLWDIEESQIVEVGSFSVDNYGAAVWTFTLNDVRAETYPYKLILAGDLTGESFTFYINGGEGGTTITTTPTTTETITTETTTTTTTIPEPTPTVIDAPLIPTELQWILLAGVLITIYFLEKRRREQ